MILKNIKEQKEVTFPLYSFNVFDVNQVNAEWPLQGKGESLRCHGVAFEHPAFTVWMILLICFQNVNGEDKLFSSAPHQIEFLSVYCIFTSRFVRKIYTNILVVKF